MIDIPNSPTNGSTITLGTTKYTYQDGKLTPFMIKQVGTELTSPKLNVETLTEYRHPISGKPIYTKTINFGAWPNNTVKYVYHNILNAEDLSLDEANSFTISAAGAFHALGNYYANGDGIAFLASTSNISIKATGNYSQYTKSYITLRYTKTTDTASSPVASLYTGSLNELNLNQETHAGYRRNGKDVYQIEVDFGVMPNNTSKDVSIPNYNAAYDYYVRVDLTQVTNGPNNKLSGTYSYGEINYLISVKMSNINAISNFNTSGYTAKVVLHYTK